ncbi:MAG: hypothetical protein KF696_07925 [Planctomycetes bacterium]|nr:hypothetical protein [Planctomycetota bacterium]MCW8135722.1 hypothetical protein [Planctomycetota bacterium]
MAEEHEPYEASRKQVRNAQVALNVLVILSALAASCFFFFMLYTIRPFGGGGAANVEIPTSEPGAIVATVQGAAGGLRVIVRDLDDAEVYSRQLSDRMRADMGIEQEGRLYRLALENTGKQALEVKLNTLSLTGEDGATHSARWIDGVASRDNASALGKLRIAQSNREFTLPPGATRQMEIFVPGDPPPAARFTKGRINAGSVTVDLEHVDNGTAQ